MRTLRCVLVVVVALVVASGCGQTVAPGQGTSASRAAALKQRPLVKAANLLKSYARDENFTGIEIGDGEVLLHWKDPSGAKGLDEILEPARQIAPVRIVPAENSAAELRAAREEIRSALGANGPDELRNRPDGSGLDLVVYRRGSNESDPERLEQITESVAKLGLGVKTNSIFEEAPIPLSRGTDSPPWSGGSRIRRGNFLCTSGFGVRNGDGDFLLTAAHCGPLDSTWTNGGQTIGTVVARSAQDDVMIISANDGASNLIYVGPGTTSEDTKTVLGFENVFVGEILCQSGVSSAIAVGGPVCGLLITSGSDDPGSTWHARQMDDQEAARPGDSGGPVYREDADDTVFAKGTSTSITGIPPHFPQLNFHSFVQANQDFAVDIAQ